MIQVLSLLCVRCLLNGGRTKPQEAVTIMGGDALCRTHLGPAMKARRGAEAHLARLRKAREARGDVRPE